MELVIEADAPNGGGNDWREAALNLGSILGNLEFREDVTPDGERTTIRLFTSITDVPGRVRISNDFHNVLSVRKIRAKTTSIQ
jgi:hypothetical protein